MTPDQTFSARARRMANRVPGLSRYEAKVRQLEAKVRQLDAKTATLAEELRQARQESAQAARGAEFVPPGHFYSAVPDIAEARRFYDRLESHPLDAIPGVELRVDEQWQLLAELSHFLDSMPFSELPQAGLRYGFQNGAFGHGDGTMLHLMLRRVRPARLIEIGSGHSSACTLDTIDLFLDNRCSVTFIEPYDQLLRSLLKPGDEDWVTIVAEPVQHVPLSAFQGLEDGDLLFIDSTHVSKAGSDVNFLFFEVLPALAPGVVIHLHDVFPGFEYPWEWIAEGRAWQEDYLLRAFLQFNEEFDVLLWPSLLARLDEGAVTRDFPQMKMNPGGSIYLRRRGGRPLVSAASSWQ